MSRLLTAERVLAVDRFTTEPLALLLQGKIDALIVHEYSAPATTRALAQAFENAPELSGYDAGNGTNEVKKIGPSIFEIGNFKKRGFDSREAAAEQYFSKAPALRARLRDLAEGHDLPTDVFLKDLKRAWPHGADVLEIGGRPCFHGLVRAFLNGGEARPHTDRADHDWPTPETCAIRQFAVNVRLATDGGGELELWSHGPETRADYAALQVDGDYSLRRDLIGPPGVVVTPRTGELCVFDATKIHAVRPAIGRTRISQSCFIGFRDFDSPLSIFS